MKSLEDLEQFLRQQRNQAAAEDVDRAGAYDLYTRDVEELQEQIRAAGWVAEDNIPEAFPGTVASQPKPGARPRKPSEKVLPTPHEVIEQFETWSFEHETAWRAGLVAKQLIHSDNQFRARVELTRQLPPRVGINPEERRAQLGEQLRIARHFRHMSIGAVAVKALLHAKGVQKIEHGKTDPQLNTLAKVLAGGFALELTRRESFRLAARLLQRPSLEASAPQIQRTLKQLHARARQETGQADARFQPETYLREIRQQRGLSTLQVAAHSGHPSMYESYIRKYEAGLIPQFTRFLGWMNGLRLSDVEAGVAWTLYLQREASAYQTDDNAEA